MREIKFRAWDLLNNRMLSENYLWDIPYNELFIRTPDQRPFNIMQYTGLKDKNGKEIFEGDIIKYSDGEEFIEQVIQVPECGTGHYIRRLSYGYYSMNPSVVEKHDMKVIGNIYENPELVGDRS